tara:strand:+ start:111 stop:536 length:426 start_codon:yes stop_codon:yes gene_type:complete
MGAPLYPILVAFGRQVFKIASKKLADDAVNLGGKTIKSTDRRTKTVSNIKQLKKERQKFQEKTLKERDALKALRKKREAQYNSPAAVKARAHRQKKLKKLRDEGAPLDKKGNRDMRFKVNKEASPKIKYGPPLRVSSGRNQ